MNRSSHFSDALAKWCGLLCLLTVLVSPVCSQTVDDPSKRESSAATSGNVSPASDAAKDALAGLREMIRKLDSGMYFEFRDEHSPRRGGAEPVNEKQIPLRDIAQYGRLNQQLKIVRDVTPVMDAGDAVARFAVPTKQETAIDAGPYPAPAPDDQGYGDQPETVIAAAIADLNAGKYESLMQNMFPPAMTVMMKTDGRWDPLVKSLTPDSPMVRQMIADLTLMQTVEPQIDGPTATFLLPNQVIQPGRQPERNGKRRPGESFVSGTRQVKLSRVGESWRFYDSASAALREQQLAYARKPEEDLSRLIVLEKIDGHWRLSK